MALRLHKYIPLLLVPALLAVLSGAAFSVCRARLAAWEAQRALSILADAAAEKAAAITALSDGRIDALTVAAELLRLHQAPQRIARLAALSAGAPLPVYCYADAEGMLHLPDGRIRAVLGETYYAEALSGRTFSGRLHYAFVAGAPLAYAVPVRSGGGVCGVLCAFDAEERLAEALADRQFGGAAVYCLANRDGIVQLSADPALPAGERLQGALAASGGGDHETKSGSAAAGAETAAFFAALAAGRAASARFQTAAGQGGLVSCATGFGGLFLVGILPPEAAGASSSAPVQALPLLFGGILSGGLLLCLCQALLLRKTLLAASVSQARAYAQLSEKARTDRLTGLLNRDALEQEIERFLAAEGSAGCHALLLIDLDNFKAVNDTFGHQDGDALLAAMAQKMLRRFRSGDVIGRLGGDEFLLLLKNVGDAAAAGRIASALCAELSEDRERDGKAVRVTASIGVALCCGGRADFPTLYREADSALYAAKREGKSRFAFFSGQSAPK